MNSDKHDDKDDLLCIADTKLVLGNWYAECVMNGKSLPDFAAMLGICTASYGQTRAIYQHLTVGSEDYAALERGRGPAEIASMELLDIAPQDWEDFILTTWLAETATWSLAAQYVDGTDRAIGRIARKIGEEAYFHLKYATGWFSEIATSDDAIVRLSKAFDLRYPLVADWFADHPALASFTASIAVQVEQFGLQTPPSPAPVPGFDSTRRRRTPLPPALYDIVRFKDEVYAH